MEISVILVGRNAKLSGKHQKINSRAHGVSGPMKMYDSWRFENVFVNSLQDALQDRSGMA
jgi:hypothetical protein